MPEFFNDYPLNKLNTFGLPVKAKYFTKPKTEEELIDSINRIKQMGLPMLVLGGGSNILFTRDYAGVVLQPSITGIEEIENTSDYIALSVGAGEVWDNLVEYAVQRGLGGIENLSNIPGSVGASPIQNIGAYGVEAKETILQVMGFNLETMSRVVWKNEECQFGYRDSIFKRELKGKVVITNVIYRLSKHPKFVTHYGNIEDELAKMDETTLINIRKAVINIRNSKLPDPNKLGNAGSFFKNPIVHMDLLHELKKRYDRVPSYPIDDKSVKIPAGWLIEQSGWKGKRLGNAGVHENQALVLVNHGGATGVEILNLAEQIRSSVQNRFNVMLEMEVNVV